MSRFQDRQKHKGKWAILGNRLMVFEGLLVAQGNHQWFSNLFPFLWGTRLRDTIDRILSLWSFISLTAGAGTRCMSLLSSILGLMHLSSALRFTGYYIMSRTLKNSARSMSALPVWQILQVLAIATSSLCCVWRSSRILCVLLRMLH